jgi:hypothetical protein
MVRPRIQTNVLYASPDVTLDVTRIYLKSSKPSNGNAFKDYFSSPQPTS